MIFFGNIKKEVAGIVMRAEILSHQSGTSIFETLDAYATELKKDSKDISAALGTISRKIRGGTKRWDAYKQHLDTDILRLLRTAEEKSIPASEIFLRYAPVKILSEGYVKSVKSGLITPVVMFAILSLVFSFVVGNFSVINDVSDKKISTMSMFIIDNYLYITSGLLVFFIYMFFIIPQKMPLLKSIFRSLDGLLILSTVSTLFKMGYGASETLPVIQKQFSLVKAKRTKADPKGLVEMLKINQIITTVEGADIKISIEMGEFERAINSILKNKLEDVEGMNKQLGKVTDNISVLLMAIPTVLVLIVFGEVMAIITSAIGG